MCFCDGVGVVALCSICEACVYVIGLLVKHLILTVCKLSSEKLLDGKGNN